MSWSKYGTMSHPQRGTSFLKPNSYKKTDEIVEMSKSPFLRWDHALLVSTRITKKNLNRVFMNYKGGGYVAKVLNTCFIRGGNLNPAYEDE